MTVHRDAADLAPAIGRAAPAPTARAAHAEPPPIPPERLTVALTAAEAFPLYERLFLEAEQEVLAAFRIFEPLTRLRSEAARAVGETWFDLVAHTLRRGVPITLYLSDFDPIAVTRYHRRAYTCLRQLMAAAEIAGPDAAPLRVYPVAHPARVGRLPGMVLRFKAAAQLAKEIERLTTMALHHRRRALDDAPGLRRYLHLAGDVIKPRVGIPELIPGSHHQKIMVVDRRRVSLGGLDINERRWDTPEHDRPAEETWHDVQLFFDDEVRGRAAADHILSFQAVCAGERPPLPAPGLIRTLSARRAWNLPYLSPKPLVTEIAAAHRRRVFAARELIYLETQFFRDLRLATRLARAAVRRRNLGLILMIPGAPEDVAFRDPGPDARMGEWLQVQSLRTIRRAFGPRLFVGAPVQPRTSESTGRDALHGGPIVYIHAKVSIFDESAAIVSSANLNGRSLYWDTEIGVELTHPNVVADLRERAFRHWLPADAGPEFFASRTAVAAWRNLAFENRATMPEARRGFVLPYDPAPAERFGRDLPGVPNEMV